MKPEPFTDEMGYFVLFSAQAQVRKLSGKPFKSTFKVNTVKGLVRHPITSRICYTFHEDDTYVECMQCEPVDKCLISRALLKF